ncbi:hypothetical protein AK88_02026 [Plasmodium fragile]|uniref:Uncharacterized protein n=1 Tax=Plasmodium fragile TaxID=5857 RepID=A0A0D9QME3_PLAFR|nr:uncharacterized protein AK88_02026 [Plasmodium fragile]KJP88245.1 hypothetical protein AK88_02026 [Plasmodium fragile]
MQTGGPGEVNPQEYDLATLSNSARLRQEKMSLEFVSDQTLQIKCSYLIEKYKKKLQKVKQLKRELQASLEKKRKEIYMDRYFLNKEREHLYSELEKEKEKIEMEHLEKTKQLYNSYFADIFLYEQEYYQCIYKVFKNLLLKKEEIDDKERRVLMLQEHARMTNSDRNVSEKVREEIRKKEIVAVHEQNGRADRAPINHPEKMDHDQDDKHIDIDNLCDLNINEIYRSIILDQGERPHNLSSTGDEFSNAIMGKIHVGTNSTPVLDEVYQCGSGKCSSVSITEKSDHEEEGMEKIGTCKEYQFVELSSHGQRHVYTEEIRNNTVAREDNCVHDEATQSEEDKENAVSKSGGTEQCGDMSEEGGVESGGSVQFADEEEEIKCLENEKIFIGEQDDPNEYHPNSNDAYIAGEYLKGEECMGDEEVDEQYRRSAIDITALSETVKEEVQNDDLFENRELANPQKDIAELDQVIENNINFNISSYFSGSYDDIADCEVLERIDGEVVALNDDGAHADDKPEYDMIKELVSDVNSKELVDLSENNHDKKGDTQKGEICIVGDPTKQKNLNEQIDLELHTNQTSAIKNEEDHPQGNNPLSSFNEHINNFYNEYEHMRRFNEENKNIQSSIFKTLYSYHNEYSIPIEKMQTFENYVEEIGQLENYEHIISFINGGAEEKAIADCDDDPNGSYHVISKKPVDMKVNSNLGMHTVKELINYVSASAKGNDNDKNGFKKKKQRE